MLHSQLTLNAPVQWRNVAPAKLCPMPAAERLFAGMNCYGLLCEVLSP
ncbi:hypothetical protein QWZ13_14225 [Reinekea marina]|nr:hypothetical protein [Reinekea marina]MDN3650073.1 hypothetical protein [Reinekea marina]